ncbi:hypothetical protein BDZ89DRAFT_1065361 [Hymenopellis radicata]|nr:hypothetical protein BDZ89DRAFT_1065361 [Hymenopellis radicata]
MKKGLLHQRPSYLQCAIFAAGRICFASHYSVSSRSPSLHHAFREEFFTWNIAPNGRLRTVI